MMTQRLGMTGFGIDCLGRRGIFHGVVVCGVEDLEIIFKPRGFYIIEWRLDCGKFDFFFPGSSHFRES